MTQQNPRSAAAAPDEGFGCIVTILLLIAAVALPVVPYTSSDIADGTDRGVAVRMMWLTWPVGFSAGLVYAVVEMRKLRSGAWRPGAAVNRNVVWPLGFVVSIVAMRGSAAGFGAVCGLCSGFLIVHGVTSGRRRRILREVAQEEATSDEMRQGHPLREG